MAFLAVRNFHLIWAISFTKISKTPWNPNFFSSNIIFFMFRYTKRANMWAIPFRVINLLHLINDLILSYFSKDLIRLHRQLNVKRCWQCHPSVPWCQLLQLFGIMVMTKPVAPTKPITSNPISYLGAGSATPQWGQVCALGETVLPQTLHSFIPSGIATKWNANTSSRSSSRKKEQI